MAKSFIYVLISTFLLVLGTYISGTILTPYAKDMGATWLQIGILSGGMYVVRLILGTPIGKLADKRGTLTILRYSLLLYPFIAVAYFFAGNIYLLMCARLLHGIASAMMLPMGMAYVGHISPEGEEGKYMSIYNLIVILASGIGPMLSTLIADYFKYKATFLLLFILAILALMVIRLSSEDNKIHVNRSNLKEIRQKGRELDHVKIIDLRESEGLIALGFANIALAVVSSLVGFFLVPYLEGKGVDLKYTGSFIAIFYLISGVIQIPLGKLIDRHNKNLATVISGFGTAAALIIFTLTDNMIILMVGMILTALMSASFLTTVSSLSVLIGRKQGMGNTMGLLSTINSAGMVFGCVSLSLIPGKGNNYELFFYYSSIIMIVSTFLFSILWSRYIGKIKIQNMKGKL